MVTRQWEMPHTSLTDPQQYHTPCLEENRERHILGGVLSAVVDRRGGSWPGILSAATRVARYKKGLVLVRRAWTNWIRAQ